MGNVNFDLGDVSSGDVSTSLGYSGLGLNAVELTSRTRIGSNLRLYSTFWRGNQYVRTYGIRGGLGVSRIAGRIGVIGGIAGAIADIRSFQTGQIGGAHLALNLTFTAVGFAGPIGTAASAGYFVGEQIYSNIDTEMHNLPSLGLNEGLWLSYIKFLFAILRMLFYLYIFFFIKSIRELGQKILTSIIQSLLR
jgi:hypothetical protein